MSKRLKNYPDPVIVIDQYGADSLRLYLINSPVVRGEELRFVEKGVKDVVREVFLPWFNAYRFFAQGVAQLEAVLCLVARITLLMSAVSGLVLTPLLFHSPAASSFLMSKWPQPPTT
jgi:hypothetical protein